MTTTLYTYSCAFCEAVKTSAIKFGIAFMAIGESTGRARAAAALHQQGFPELARKIMLDGDDK